MSSINDPRRFTWLGVLIAACLPLTAGGIPRDKQLHVAAGAVAYVAGYEIAKSLDSKHPKLWGVASALALGVAKEVYDKQHPKTHTCDAKDALATVAGGVVVSWVWRS